MYSAIFSDKYVSFTFVRNGLHCFVHLAEVSD